MWITCYVIYDIKPSLTKNYHRLWLYFFKNSRNLFILRLLLIKLTFSPYSIKMSEIFQIFPLFLNFLTEKDLFGGSETPPNGIFGSDLARFWYFSSKMAIFVGFLSLFWGCKLPANPISIWFQVDIKGFGGLAFEKKRSTFFAKIFPKNTALNAHVSLFPTLFHLMRK